MNNIRVRLPRKLAKSVSGGVLAEEGRLNPVGAMGITLNMLPVHRVNMTLSENDLPLAMHDLVEVYNHKGSVGIYRVTKIPHTIGKNRKYELSHGLDVLSDATFDMIEEYKGTVDGMLAKIINAQTQMIGGVKYWQLGTCEDTNPWNKDIKYDNLMECLTEIAKKEEDYMFTFDQSTFPWTLNFVARDSTVLSEFRLNRNTENCVVTEDDADLCTRLYLSVTSETNDDEGHGTYINEGYFTYNDTDAQNAGFGVVCKTAGVNQEDFTSQAALEAWVAAYFGRHNRPGVQITIDGVELNKITGESIDEVHLSRICRVALPEYSCTFNERIVSVNYPDALRKPTYVRNSLANKRQTAEDAFSEIKKTANSASKSAGGAGRSAHNDATYFRRTIGDTANGLYSRIEQTAYYIRAEVVDVANGLYSRIEETASYIRAEVADTANGLYSKIEETASYIRSEVADTANGLYSKIEETASYIRSEVSDTANGLYSKIEETASYIRSEVSDTASGLNSKIEQTASYIRSEVADTASGLRSSIKEQKDRISLVVEGTGSNAYVRPASIEAAITDGYGRLSSNITVSADKIYLLGETITNQITADYISGAIASLPTINGISASFSGNVSCAGLMAVGVYVGSGQNFTNISDGIAAVQIPTPTGNTYKLQYKKFSDSSWQDAGTFSRAVASWTMGWSGGTFTAKANPQDQSISTTITQGTASWDGTDCTIPIMGADSDNPSYPYATGRNILVSAAGVLEEKTVNGNYAGQELTPSTGKIGFSKVTVGALTEYKVSETWGSGNESNKLIISRSASGSNSITHTITASASIAFSNNKYTATGKAKVDNVEKDNDTDSSGTLAISFNNLQGSGASAYRTISLKEGSTVRMTSGNLTDYGDGYYEGYSAGWNAACALISRSGNSIIGPVSGKAHATSGRTATKYTANYTASTHSYTASSYTASSYTKETHSYTASSHSFTQATCKTNGTNHTKYWYNANFSGSVEYNPASDSYTASSHSYRASSYTASSYTAETHSYTPSSFSWS